MGFQVITGFSENTAFFLHCVFRDRDNARSSLPVFFFIETVDCCHRNGQPMTESGQQAVGSAHLEPAGKQCV